ncbi:hypothetical protein Tco_0158747 [Tanacetum coccineum]
MASIFGSKSKYFMTMSLPHKANHRSVGWCWNDPRDVAKLVKEISLPQDVLSTSDHHLIELENQVQHLMEAHLAPKSPVQVNKIASSCEIYSGPHETQYCMENPEQAFVEYAYSRVGIKRLHDDLEVTAAKVCVTAAELKSIQVVSELVESCIEETAFSPSISQEDVNQKFLRSLSPEWNTHTIVWRNKPEIDTLSMDDLYNNMKIYEPEVKGTSSSSTNTQNVAFVSSNSSTDRSFNTAHGATTASTQATAVNSTTIDNLSDAVADGYANTKGKDILEEHWKEIFDKSKSDQTEKVQLTLHSWLTLLQVLTLRELRKKLEIAQKEKDGIQFNVDKFENASKSLNKLIESQIVDNRKKGLGYNAVPPPYTGNFMPLTPDLSFTGLNKFVNKPIAENSKDVSSEEEPKVAKKCDDALVIEEWVSDDEEEDVSQTKTKKKTVMPSIAKIEFVKPKQQEKTARKTVKQVKKHRQNTHNPRGNQIN